MYLVAVFLTCLLAAYAIPSNNTNPRASCTISSYDDVSGVISSCTDITVTGFTVPGGKTLDLQLKDGSSVRFEGTLKFDYHEWDGPLLHIKGKGFQVSGASGHVLDGQGGQYWDGKGGSGGVTKPKFVRIEGTDGSVAKDINILNCPKACVSVGSKGLTISNWNVDVSAGDANGGHNTDGFDVSSSSDVLIENTVVRNQDDCVAINHGSNLRFTGLTCYGGHGLSISVGLSKTDGSTNTVSDVVFSDCKVYDSANGIHVKTHPDGAAGYIKDVTYKNIELKGITNFGVEIQEDYGDTGHPKANVPITGLTLDNVAGTMTGKSSMPLYILCADSGCDSWHFSGISISGNGKKSSCNYTPSGFSC